MSDKRTVLIVMPVTIEFPTFRENLKAVLEAEGFNVRTTVYAESACTLIKDIKPDAVVTALDLPMNNVSEDASVEAGGKILNSIYKLPDYEQPKVIVIDAALCPPTDDGTQVVDTFLDLKSSTPYDVLEVLQQAFRT